MTRYEPAMTEEQITLADVLMSKPGDEDYVDSDNGQCCCGDYNCQQEYIHWTSGF